MSKKKEKIPKDIWYMTKMNAYVHDHNYPITKVFEKKSTALEFLKRALRIFPYVKITLHKKFSNVGYYIPIEEWKMENKKGRLTPKKKVLR